LIYNLILYIPVKESGWKKKAAGVWTKGEKEFTITVCYIDEPLNTEMAQHIKESWERLGIGVRLEKLAPADFFETLVKKAREENYPEVVIASIAAPPWVTPRHFFTAKFSPAVKGSAERINYSRWNSAENEKLCQEFYQELDWEKKNKILKEQQQLVGEEIPLIPLTLPLRVSACRNNIENYQPRGFGNTTWNVEYWKDKNQQLEKE